MVWKLCTVQDKADTKVHVLARCIHAPCMSVCMWSGLKILLRVAIIERDVKTLFYIFVSHMLWNWLAPVYCAVSTFIEFNFFVFFCFFIMVFSLLKRTMCSFTMWCLFYTFAIYLRSIMKLNRIASGKRSFRFFLDHNSSHHRDYMAMRVFS